MQTSDFALATLEAQLTFLEHALPARPPLELLQLCLPLRDPTPLVWLATQLLERELLENPRIRFDFLSTLEQLPDTTLDRVLKGLLQKVSQPPSASSSQRLALRELLLELLRRLPLERLPALSLCDRMFKQQFPRAREELLQQFEAHALAWLEQRTDACPEAWLAQLSTPAWERLRTRVLQHSPQRLELLEQHQRRIATRSLDVLAHQPRALSQANAEELLSRRVYTDPGHFLVELLQNAEDAEAEHWQLRCEPHRLLIWHDGLAFDARDVVGVTSIGQTTKRRQQIGFFGVGFKSVYEITRRPALFSGPWQFEIVDVSIPRPLEQRPSGVPSHGTLLILPLAQPEDPQRSARALFEKACALDPRLLLTLRHLRHLELSLLEPSTGHLPPHLQTRVLERQALPSPTLELERPQLQVVQLHTGQAPTPQRLLRIELERPFDPELKDPERRQPPPEPGEMPPSTRLSLVMRLSNDGLPIPLEPQASTLYSFLPTAEKTGLRLLMQAHFEVPVDRERLAPNAPFNKWLLSQLPDLLEKLCQPLLRAAPPTSTAPSPTPPSPLPPSSTRSDVSDAQASQALLAALPEPPLPAPSQTALAQALLEVLPLEQELSPLLRPLWPALREPLAGLPLLPCRNGNHVLPAQGWLLPPNLASIPGPHDPPVAIPLSDRAERLARALGTPSLTLDGLLSHYEQGDTLSQLSAEALDALLLALLEAPSSVQVRALKLPLFPSRTGLRLRAAQSRADSRGVLRVPAELEPLAAFFEDVRPLLARDAQNSPAAQLLERTQAPALSFELLGIELSGSAAWQSTLPARRESLLRLLAAQAQQLSIEVLRHAAQLPLFPDSKGRPGLLALPQRKRLGMEVLPSPPELLPLLELMGLRLLDPAWLEPLQPLLEALNVPRADLNLLLEQLIELQPLKPGEARPTLQTPAVLPRLHRLLLSEKETLRTLDPPQPREQLPPASPLLSALPLWRTQAGGVRSADQVVHPAQLPAVLTEDPGLQPLLAETCLASDDVALFEALSPLLQPLPVSVWLDRRVRAGVREHRPLEEQPPLLSTPTRLARVLAHQLLHRPQTPWLTQPLELPLLDAQARLRLDSLYFASEATVKLLEGYPLHGTLLHPVLSESWGWPPPEPLLLRLHLLDPADVLEELARRPLPLARLPRFYAWLEQQLTPLLASTRALKILQEAPFFLNAAGELVTPRGLLLDPELQSLGLDWTPSPLLPPTLLSALAHPLQLGLPSPQRLAQALTRLPEAPEKAPLLAQLVRRLLQTSGKPLTEALRLLPLGTVAWLPDANGQLRYAHELFPSHADVAELVGGPEEQPGIWLNPSVETLLGTAVLNHLPLRIPEQVQVEEVLAFINLKVLQRRTPSTKVYAWLERSLVQQKSTPEQLKQQLGRLPWIKTDDGEIFAPHEVLGCSAWRFFGRQRGYWEQGGQHYPRLLEAFDIPRSVRPLDVLRFLGQLPERLKPASSGAGLGLPDASWVRQLLACYALLGRSGEPIPLETPYLLVEPRGPAHPPTSAETAELSELRLVSPFTVAVFRSNTPTLEALFSKVGHFWKVVQGPVEDREGLELFHQRLRIPRISEAWSLHVQVEPEKERTQALTPAIEALRRVLRALLEVYPRLRAHRSTLEPSGWQAELRLRGLVRGGHIRAFEQLKALYQLPGVGETSVEAKALYDTRSESLMLDVRALLEPQLHRSELAMGLLPTLYDGPGADQLVDILELLLPLEETRHMQAYLDRRHFPVAMRALDPLDRLQERWVELCGLGLLAALRERFEFLASADLTPWESASFWSQCRVELPTSLERPRLSVDEKLRLTARFTAEQLLSVAHGERSGAEQDRLLLTLYRLLLAENPLRTLRQLGLLPAAQVEDAVNPGSSAFDQPWREGWELASAEASSPLASAQSGASEVADEPLPGRDNPSTSADTPEPNPTGFWQTVREGGLLRRLNALWQRAGGETPAPRPAGDRQAELLPPSWSEPGGIIRPLSFVESNAWATEELRQALRQRPSPLRLRVQPFPLTAPWGYSILTVGARFFPKRQRWLELPLELSAYQPGEPTARRVKLEGTIPVGLGLLPMPLYSRLHGGVEVKGSPADAARLKLLPSQRGIQPISVRAAGNNAEPLSVRYEVELLEPPSLLPGGMVSPSPALLETSLPLTAMPEPVQRWVRQLKQRALPPHLRALEVRQFVVGHFCYDEHFKRLPKVKAKLERLRPEQGNHALELLFAGADDSCLGRGVCYELNVLVAELLRHVEVPSLVAHGWMLDEELLAWPDHLFALALVSSGQQPLLLPLDASVSREGQRLGARSGADAVGVMRLEPPLPPPPGLWSQLTQVPPASATERNTSQALHDEQQRLRSELQSIQQAHQLLSMLEPPMEPSLAPSAELLEAMPVSELDGSAKLTERIQHLRKLLVQRLGDGARAAVLLQALKGELSQLKSLTPEVQALVARGLLEVQTLPVYQVRVRRRARTR